MRKYEESKTTRIMMATVPHVTSGLGLRKFQADGFLLTRVYMDSVTGEADLLAVSRGPCPMQLLIVTEEFSVDLGSYA